MKALEKAASRARNGIRCSIPAFADNVDPVSQIDLVSRQCGGQNCHVDVQFADRVTWIARIRLDSPHLPPPAVQAHIFLSEVATLKFLSNTRVPAPQVYAYELEAPNNAVGTSYVLMEKLPGKPLDWGCATTEQRARVMEQLADVYLELERHPILQTGSLVHSAGSDRAKRNRVDVGSFAQTPCFETPDLAVGPFGTLEAAYTAIIRQQQRMLANHEVSTLPVDNYLSFFWRLKVLPELVAESVSRIGPFYLRHQDDKGDHILVDNDYNITGIIDWEWASAEAKEVAFNSPCMMWPVADFYDGKNALAEDEERFAAMFEKRGRSDMASIVRGGRRWQRYLFFLGGMPWSMTDFEGLFQGLRKSFLGVDDKEQTLSSYRDWKQGALARFVKGDAQLQALMRDERAKRRQVPGVLPRS